MKNKILLTYLIGLISVLFVISCDSVTNPSDKEGNHTLKVKNYCMYDDVQRNFKVYLEDKFIMNLSYNSTNSHGGISSGEHYVEFKDDDTGFTCFIGIKFEGYGATLTLIITPGGDIIEGYYDFGEK